MAQDKITEIFDIDAIRANRAAAMNEARSAVKELGELQSAIKSSTSIGGSAENAEKAQKGTKELTASLKEYIAQNERLIVAQAKLAQATSDDAKALAVYKVELANVTKQQKEDAQAISATTSAYEKLNIQHKQAIKAYQDAAAAGKLSAQQLVVLKDNANKLGDQLVKIDSAVGNYRRNVGNYSSAWNGLGNSINQISRELPNFAQSMQLGILAISNNLPILSDEIIRAKDNIALMKKEGKDVPSLFSQIAKSIFSWQTAMTIAITVAVAYGDKIAMALSGETEATRKLKEEQKKLIEEREQGILSLQKSAAQEQATAQVLYKTATDITQSYKLRKQAVDDLQKSYPNYFGNLSLEAILAGEAAAQYNELNKALLVKASLMANEKELERLSFETNELERQVKKGKERLEQIDSKPNSEGDYQAQLMITNRLEGKLIDKNRERQEIVEDILEKEKAIEKLLIRQDKAPIARSGKGGKKGEDKLAEDTINMYDLIQKKMNDFALDEQEVRSRNLAYLRTQLEAGLISVAQYENEKQVIIKNSEAYILQEQTKFLAQSLNELGLNEKDSLKVIELWQNKMIALKQKGTDAEEAQVLISAKNLEAFQDAMYKNKERKDREEAEKEKRIQREKAKYIQDLAQETAAFIFTLLDAQSQKEISEFEKAKERISEEYNLKNSAVEKAAITEEEKTARKLVLAAEEEEQQKRIDEEIRKIKRKQAIFEKAQALATIAINTAIALSNPTNLASFGSISPFIIGLGAAQAAVVLATPLPEYAKGKKASDSYEGLAIAGEAGTEMKIDKDGKLELLTKPTLINTKRGDTILSNKQLMSGELGKHIKTEKEKANYDDLIKAYSYHTDRTIKAIKNSPSNVIIDNSNYNLNIQKARA